MQKFELVPLSTEEKQRLQSLNSKSSMSARVVLSLVALFIYSLINETLQTEDNGKWLIVPILIIFYLIGASVWIGYIRASRKDLIFGMKKIFRDVIKEKNHTISRSESTQDEGGRTNTIESHTYNFIFNIHEPLSIDEMEYNQFKQGDTVQVELLGFSNKFLRIFLVKSADELKDSPLLDTSPEITQEYPLVEQTAAPFEEAEIASLEYWKQSKIYWYKIYIFVHSSLLCILMIILNNALFDHSKLLFYNIPLVILLAFLWNWRKILSLQHNYLQCLRKGKLFETSKVIDKEIIYDSVAKYMLNFENIGNLQVSQAIYNEINVNNKYLVSWTKINKRYISIQTEDKAIIWSLPMV